MKKAFILPEVSLPKSLLHPVGRAISDHEMIREGDRVLIGLSGGKDSQFYAQSESDMADVWSSTSDKTPIASSETGL